MPDRGAAVGGLESWDDGRQASGDLVHRPQEAARAKAELSRDRAHRCAVAVVLHQHVGEQPVAEEGLRQDAGRPGLNGASAPWTTFDFQDIDDTLNGHGRQVEYGARPPLVGVQGFSAAGTVRGG